MGPVCFGHSRRDLMQSVRAKPLVVIGRAKVKAFSKREFIIIIITTIIIIILIILIAMVKWHF